MSEAVTRQFLARLWELQVERGLSDAALAHLIGCSPSYISHLKRWSRPRRLGLDIALAATRAFPELLSLLLSELPESNTEYSQSNDPEEGAANEG